jgi:hypothetical protein
MSWLPLLTNTQLCKISYFCFVVPPCNLHFIQLQWQLSRGALFGVARQGCEAGGVSFPWALNKYIIWTGAGIGQHLA